MVVVAAVLTLVVGCDAQPPAPEKPPTTSSEPPVVAPGEPVAALERPVNGLLARPCDLLTSRQIAQLDLLTVRTQTGPRGVFGEPGLKSCLAERPITGSSPDVLTDSVSIFPSVGSDVLSEAVHSAFGLPPDVTNLTVRDLPAALIGEADSDTLWACTFAVRTGQAQGVEIEVKRFDLSYIDDTCLVAAAIGGAVVTNLPSRS